jgi:hypothetical protein
MNEIMKQKTTLPADEAGNTFEIYGNAATTRSITGTLLKFSKGDYLAGQDGVDVPVGTRFVAQMESLTVGWVRWENNAPTEQRMGSVADAYQPERRGDLGDMDKATWETDDDGKPRDPWQFSNYLILRRVDHDEIFTFVTSSKGGLSAIGELCKGYGKTMRQKPDQSPVIELGVDSYQHRDRSLGRIKFPTFVVVDWVAKDANGNGSPAAANKPKQASSPKAAAHKPTAKAGAAQF